MGNYFVFLSVQNIHSHLYFFVCLFTVAANRTFDHMQADCFACAILSHGNHVDLPQSNGYTIRHDVVFGVDGELVLTKQIVELFSDVACPELTGKPRLFFIQV